MMLFNINAIGSIVIPFFDPLSDSPCAKKISPSAGSTDSCRLDTITAAHVRYRLERREQKLGIGW